MKVVQTISSQIFFVTIKDVKYKVDSVAEYLLDNGLNQFKYCVSEYVDLGDTYELKSLGTKLYDFDSLNTDYIERYTKGKMVKYTKEVIETLVKIALR